MKNNNGKKIEYEHRLTRIETFIKVITEDIGDIKKDLHNHINDLGEKIDDVKYQLNKRPNWMVTALVTITTGLIIFIITYFAK